jgi:acetyl-CoA carboxylase carboxyltransferase component
MADRRRARSTSAGSPKRVSSTASIADPQQADAAAFELELALRAYQPSAVRVGVSSLGERLGPRRAITFEVDAADAMLDLADGEAIAVAAQVAKTYGRPLVGVISAQGTDVFDGLSSLHGWGVAARHIAACSGVVPVILVVRGPVVSGPSLLLGLADFVVMTADSYAFMSGPSMVADFTGLQVDNTSLGGSDTHARTSGLATQVVPDLEAALDVVADLLAFLPDHVDNEPPLAATTDPIERDAEELASIIPSTSTGSYDVRRVIEAIVDDRDFFEVKARWAANLVVGFGRVGGRSVGIVANQPIALAGTLDIPAAQKGAWFVAFCDSFGIPLITFVDTPGYFPGKDLEWRGMIRHGAQMAFAYAEASVGRVCVVLRKAYGGAYIVMDCKTMGNDLCVAWPSAELAVMGAKGAVQILNRRDTDEVRAEREAQYALDYLNPFVAAERGYVDAVINPEETRRWVGRAISLLASKRELLQPKRHGNSPL